MIRSLWIAKTGLDAQQTQLDEAQRTQAGQPCGEFANLSKLLTAEAAERQLREG